MKLPFIPSFLIRESAANSATSGTREAAVANSVTDVEAIDFSESADGWFKISPYGVFRGKQPGRQQHVSIENAKLMEDEFNSLLGKLGRAFRGIPIYHGHPDVDPEIWPDDRRIGKVTQIQARPDGLWGFAEWNSIGEDNKREGWWIYPSPRWDAPAGGSRFTPDRLISIGLTNTPRIEESEPVFNSDQQTKPDNTMDPALIRQKLGLLPESTDEEVIAKIEALQQAATDAEAKAMEAENAKNALTTEKDQMACSLRDAQAAATKAREDADNAILDLAERDGKITKAERPEWQTKLSGDSRDEAVNALGTLTPKLNTKALDKTQNRESRENSDTVREQVANSVAEMQATQGLSYHDAWLKAKADPKFASFFNPQA